ncbi:PucR family transcriptional regulator [Clostridiaceae bacterium UIB06]|nr:PucR family transcriptional regulator [Clostridiaceae bacterium UIB06]
MSILVREALELEILKEFKVIAGKKGLSNEITHVAVWDYENRDLIAENFSKGDFALSTLVAIKDKIEDLYGIVEKMIEIGISSLAIKCIYFKNIPDDVIKLADSKNFPIMMFSDTFTEDVILNVHKAINEKNEYENLALQIDNILYNNLNDLSIKKIAHKINMNFKEKNIVAFCRKKSSKLRSIKSFSDKQMEEAFSKVIPYKEGYLLINTFEEAEPKDIDKTILRRLEWWGFTKKEYVIGVSSLHEDLGSLNNSILESLYAFKYSTVYKKDISSFHEIGINKIILPILDNPWVLKYYSKMIEPLIVYDNHNETELLKTAIKYVENNGDIKVTAEELFQHNNTVRYRIDKINKLLSESCKIQHFYEELSLAVRIYILSNSCL